jgi:two-component system sensor histidine kinase GlrK
MQLFTTRSIRQLTILGFVTVAALLISALVVTARQLDSLSEQSQVTVAAAVSAMSASRQLIEQSIAMERNARQFAVLGDETLRQLYRDRRAEFLEIIAQMEALDFGVEALQITQAMRQLEATSFASLDSATPERANTLEIPELASQAYRIADAIGTWIDAQQAQLLTRSERTKQTLSYQALLFIGAAAALAVLFVSLITRPLQQINSAISSIGSGAYDQHIVIAGPQDLQVLGRRLDWLRGRLQQLEQHRSTFLRHVSHELKTPLASMQEGAALLNEGVVGSLTDQQREISLIIANNCARLQTLIEDLLRHNSQNFEVLDIMPKAIRLDELVLGVVQAHQLAISNGKIHVRGDLKKCVVTADPERLRVIVDNLFTNALKFSPNGGEIELRLFGTHDSAVFEIQDQGAGVAELDREKIFDAFFQGVQQSTKPYSGSGLGLAIARDYAIAGGGELTLENSTEGACFRLSIPLVSS